MKKIIAFILMFSFFSVNAHALVVTAKSISAGTYEDGEFTRSNSGFTATYSIDEEAEKVTLERIEENNREGKFTQGAVYDITNVVVSRGLSSLMVSRNKKDQRIITAVRESDLGASETIILGEDFYEYSRAANGKFYLEYGEVN